MTGGEPDHLRFNILGTLEGWAGGTRLRFGGAIQERVLATLLFEPGRIVPVTRLIEAAWDEEPPPSAEHQVRKAVSELRRRIPRGAGVVVTDAPGYRIELGDGQLDLNEFAELLRVAHAAVGAGRTATAEAALRQALALWRGPVMAGRGGRVIEAAATAWEERRLTAAEQHFGLRLALGEAAELIGDLRDLISRHPLRETLRGHLMLALYRSGRGAEALEEYAAVRRLLVEELGVDPGAQLTRLYEGILREDLEPAPSPAEPRPAPATPVSEPGPADRGVCTLPYDLTDFAGRDDKLRLLLEKAGEPGGGGTRIIALDGMGGSGKTTLAVRAAHRLADHYPDGQLFIDLRGFTPGERPLQPAVALESLLRSLGVPDEQLPEGTEERTALWRVTVARKRVLILLDNAADPSQVIPLLPASSGCLVLITSRGRLVDLDGAEWIGLGMLAPEESATLLAETLGAERTAAEPEAVAELAELCGRLPLALRIAAARLRNRPRWTVAHLVERLSHETRRLDELSTGRRSVTATLELSYQALSASGRAGFRLLGQHPGTEIDVWSAAALTGTSVQEAEDLLEGLLDAHMMQQHALGLYSFHDLVRSFARSLPGDDAGGGALGGRLLPYYLDATEAACGVLFPDRLRMEFDVEVPSAAELPPLRTAAQAMDWLDREYHTIQLAMDREGDLADPACVVRLSRNLAFYLYTRSKPDEQVAQGLTAVRAARRLGDQRLLCLSLNNLGVAQWRVGRFREGIESVSEARRIARALGDEVGEAMSVGRLGLLHLDTGELAEAVRCLEQAVVLRRESGYATGEADSWANLSSAYRRLGRHHEAVAAAEEALRISRRVGAPGRVKLVLNDLAAGLLGMDQPERALAVLDEGLAPVDETRQTENHALTLALSAEARQLLGDTERALRDADRAREIVSRSGVRLRASEVENIAGRVHRRAGDPAQALRLHRLAFDHATALGYRAEVLDALTGLACAAEELGEKEAAAGYRTQARDLQAELGIGTSEGQ
ncbi:AfsR/SARP family transcriptional regulator [Streptomyces sp. TRM68416]|uniref:AfsR/SARP family transcriptional regulator n=1 Tax=Streptomyces sp. TRM68416 TaxID=2758412 RepID=UPI001CB71CEE|nr:BTAD domain-containing putative transcriptional regulator [Streptomyces sp. TRM68416]